MSWERKSTEYRWRFRGDIIGFCFFYRDPRGQTPLVVLLSWAGNFLELRILDARTLNCVVRTVGYCLA